MQGPGLGNIGSSNTAYLISYQAVHAKLTRHDLRNSTRMALPGNMASKQTAFLAFVSLSGQQLTHI